MVPKSRSDSPSPSDDPAGAAGPDPDSLGLGDFRGTADDLGLSLDELGAAYAALTGGDDPYAPAPQAPDHVPESAEDEIVLAGLFAAEQRLAEASRRIDPDRVAAAREAQAREAGAPPDSPGAGPSGPAAGRPFAPPVRDLAPADAATQTAVLPLSRSSARGPGWDAAGRTPRDRCEISPRTILEAMLFVGHPANQPLTSKQIAGLMRGVLPREIDELVQELNESYAAEGAPYRIDSDGAGYRMTLTSEFASLRDKFLGRVREVRLAPPVVDVLAIVAYNQPIGRDEVDRLRNKSSGAILGQLVRRGLLRVDLSDERQRQPTYYTTDRFLELFRLGSLDDLPRSTEIERNFG